MGQALIGRGDSVPPCRAVPCRALPAVALAALLAVAAGSAGADIAPPLTYEALRTAPKLYETYKNAAGDRITLQVGIVRRSDPVDEKKLTELLGRYNLTVKDFCNDPSESLYVSTTLSGFHVGKAKGANAYEALSKYCLTGPVGNKIWSFVVSSTVARDYTRINPNTGDVMQHRNFALMGLSARPDLDPGENRLNRYPNLAWAVSEAMSAGAEDWAPLVHGKQFPNPPRGAPVKRLSTSDAYASAVDIGGLALLAKTINLPLSAEEPMTPLIIIQGRIIPLVLSVRELPQKEGDAYTPFQLEVRAKQGAQPIVVRVKGDRGRTIEDVDLPFMQGMVSLYETFRPFLGQ